MNNDNILLQKGQRGIIVGQTGSGKTVGAIWQLQHAPLAPVLILDTKGEPAFDKIARAATETEEAERLEIYEDTDKFLTAYRKGIDAEYIIIRPSPEEIAEPLAMDNILMQIYNAGRSCLTYIDEAYQWHINGRAGPGLVGLLTRGRSKGMTTLISTQRPAWISRFCFSEAQKFYIYRLSDRRDMKTLGEFLPDFHNAKIPEKFHFYYYDTNRDDVTMYQPVPIIKPEKAQEVFSKSWI